MASYTYASTFGEGLTSMTPSDPPYTFKTYNKQMFSLTLSATSTGVAAGNIVGASAAAVTQFGIINPVGSGRNLVLLKFFMGIISGTPAPGPLFHGVITTLPSAASPGGTILNNFLNDPTKSVAKAWALAAGSALTGATAPTIFRSTAFSSTATAAASAFEVGALEYIDGDIIIPPGVMWLPLWSVSGTSLLNAYSITWYETGL